MTSESEVSKTNELRRRTLRLQQVREQSKDIAKKLRQRAKVEKLRHTAHLDGKKEREYFQQQEKLVKRLEQLYSQGVTSVGASHQKASEIKINDPHSPEKEDLSRVRGKEATAILKRKKQEKLDQQKKLLDRKVLAREAANEISREKSSSVASKLLAKSSTNLPEDAANLVPASKEKDNGNTDPNLNKNDMATQWDYEEIPNEWEPNVPKLELPKDDRESIKESNNIRENKSGTSKRLDLFALSSEMPSSLRGGLGNMAEERTNVTNARPSLTMISEYLQNRALRLRESDTTGSSKKTDDLHSLRQTILHTRSSKIEGSLSHNVCHVLDEQVVPIPSWQAESNCEFCSHRISHHRHNNESRQFTVTNSQINKIFSSIRPVRKDLHPSPVLRDSSPFRRYKACQRTFKNAAKGNVNKSLSNEAESMLTKKNSVTMYNHSTRNTRDITYGDSGLVVRDDHIEDDAYAQALKEISNDNVKEREHLKKLQDMRSKVAMTKQTVEKEYNDTMSFLKSLPKEKCSKHILKTSYMDDKRQQMQKDRRQQKLQQEFNKIDKEHRKSCGENSKFRNMSGNSSNKSKSPVRIGVGNEFESRDMQYSWMPVPESDGNLAIHTIPTKLKEGKSGNTVKFSKVDSYHEYRSRHKHTPPTKDTNIDRQTNKKKVETVLIQNDDSETLDSISSSDSSSFENLNFQKKHNKKHKQTITEEDKIIVYKVLESKKEKERKKLKLIDHVAKVLSAMDKEKLLMSKDDNNNKQNKSSDISAPMEHVNEGVYKMVNEKGLSYNVTSCYTANVEMWQTRADRKPWWENLTSLYFSDNTQKGHSCVLTDDGLRNGKPSTCSKKIKNNHKEKEGIKIYCRSGDGSLSRTANCLGCQCECVSNPKPKSNENTLLQPSAATSTSSFKTTATIDKGHGVLPDDGFFKLLNDDGQEAGKFYIGTSGFLKDDAYEVIIQLRKKESAKKEEEEKEYARKLCDNVITDEIVATLQELNMPGNLSTPPSEPEPKKTEIDKTLETNACPETVSKQHAVQEPHRNSSTSVCSLNNKEMSQEGINKPTSSTNSNKETMKSPVKTFVDKGVYTTSQLSFVFPNDFPKTDAASRPATSTYTQTSINSPNSRPVYIHMSSSTSTAYMSPPELILPKYLKQNSGKQHRQATTRDEQYSITDNFEYERDSTCTCMRCLHFEKIKINAVNTNMKHNGHKKMSTPPNTARSNGLHCYNQPIRKKHKNCRKSKGRATSNTDNNCPNRKKKRNIPFNKISSRNHVIRVRASTNKLKKNNDKVQKSNLNPVIKKYVNKLLDLNSNGLKAIKIANQECSSVSTPGSSIIDVPRNINEQTNKISNKISLEQIKDILMQQILEECIENASNEDELSLTHRNKRSEKCLLKVPRTKRSVHKVKSLNISRKILKTKKSNDVLYPAAITRPSCSTSSPSSTRDVFSKPAVPSFLNKSKNRSKSSPTPRIVHNFEFNNDGKASSDTSDFHNGLPHQREINTKSKELFQHYPKPTRSKASDFVLPLHKATITSPDSENDVNNFPNNTSTQTKQDIDSEINLVKMAEDKIQNMEKIADLTERCTKRLSNLAKVLEKVRKNKSLAYSQISTSDTASDSEHKTDKNIGVPAQESCNPVDEVQKESSGISLSVPNDHEKERKKSSQYIPILKDIPKPEDLKCFDSQLTSPTETKKIESSAHSNTDHIISKVRGKPPPALSRLTLKHNHGHDIIPHELSTVVEVDSPMSVKIKKQSSKGDITDNSDQIIDNKDKGESFNQDINKNTIEFLVNPDLLQNNNFNLSKRLKSINESSDNSKIQMMDLKQFNDVMLKPFITLQEYAKQCEVGMLDEGSNFDDNVRRDLVNDELSSLHSDGSLPDVIAELLKRNIIAEPFKFDTVSNVNSTTISSESTLSVLALSNVRKDKRKSSVVFKNKESETSDTLSISSNPDLENAFKKLGMGWASSTLKKTKERLALSSSSNTSSSSLTQFKMKHLNNQEIPELVTDSVSSTSKTIKKHKHEKEPKDPAKNVEQQTSFMNSMTVKEFLTHELAKKITFTNKSNRNDTDVDFVSLLETKMPEEMKHSSQSLRGEHSIDSLPSASNNHEGINNRARTSTPVQLFKSMTYHSSSSSNVSNGLFSNADDLSSVKGTSNSLRNHSTSDKDDLTIPNCSLRMKKVTSDSKSD